MAQRMLVAGANGGIGREVLPLARDAGYRIRALVRGAEGAAAVRGIADEVVVADALDARAVERSCDGVDVVVSALGASVSPGHPERRSYFDVDRPANLNLMSAARDAGVGRFVYVSVHVARGYAHTAYVRAHEDVVESLRTAGIGYGVVRPTGVFTAFDELLVQARRGRGIVIGDGSARTNPVHASDVARVALDVARGSEREVAVGGPDIMSRRELTLLAGEALGRPLRIWSVPPGIMRAGARVAGVRSKRLRELLEFATEVSTTDCIAPALGTRRLRDYFAEAARP
jgi:uncharacterized protein YbjT (DUF2867 family)